MKILLAGAGYVGCEAGLRLAAQGHHVTGVRRSARPLPSPLQALQTDLSSSAAVALLPDDFELVVYAVAPGARSEAAYRAAYQHGVEHLRHHLPAARFIFVSSTAVYGSEHLTIDDSTDACPDTATGKVLLEAEQAAGPEAVCLRASGIYGPGRTRLVSRLAQGLLEEAERPVWTNRVHQVDLARAIVELASDPSFSGSVIASDPTPATLGQMADWLSQQSLPSALLERRTGPSRGTSRKNRKISPTRLLARGFEFAYPSYREGYAELLSTSQ